MWLWKWRSLLLTLVVRCTSLQYLQYCKYCFPGVQGLAKREKDDESDFPFPPSLWNQLLGGIRCFRIFRGSSAKCRARDRIGVSASAGLASLDLSQFRFKWLISSVLWKCYPCRELGIGGLGPLAMEREVWLLWSMLQHLFLKTIFSSAQLHPKIFPSKRNPCVLRNQGDLVNSVTSNALQWHF